MDADFLIIGGGIVGLSTAMHVLERFQGADVLVVEKEADLATHQTGRNSGVIHAGVYYEPGSLKARFCKDGLEQTVRFCRDRGVPYEQCGKLIVATNDLELGRMDALFQRCLKNGLDVERLDAAELRKREPRISGCGAIYVTATGIVNYSRVAAAMADVVSERGGGVLKRKEVKHIEEDRDGVTVLLDKGQLRAKYVIACAGLMADRLANMCGLDVEFRIIPFRGEYFRLPDDKNDIIKHLVYPVPDPALPFLGVHLTRMIGGGVTVGPNAVLSFKREGYGKFPISARDVGEMITYRGFWNTLRKHARSAASELVNSLSRRHYLGQCRKYCRELTLSDLLPHPAGVRAQAVLPDGTLVHDFLIRSTKRTMHVCNAPSPAATAAIPIGRYVAEQCVAAVGDARLAG